MILNPSICSSTQPLKNGSCASQLMHISHGRGASAATHLSVHAALRVLCSSAWRRRARTPSDSRHTRVQRSSGASSRVPPSLPPSHPRPHLRSQSYPRRHLRRARCRRHRARRQTRLRASCACPRRRQRCSSSLRPPSRSVLRRAVECRSSFVLRKSGHGAWSSHRH